MPVMVRNKEAGPTVFSVPEDNIQVEWQGAGDPSGGDVQYVPDALVNNVQFSKAIRQGIFVIETEAAAEIEAQAQAHQDRKAASEAAATSTIEVTTNNDLVQAPCVGPAARGNGTCDAPVPVRDKDKANAPVLCSRHASLAPQFALTEVDGQSVWVRTTLAPREKQSNTPQ